MDVMKLGYTFKGDNALKELERITSKADEVQDNILCGILERNKNTEYLSKYMKGSKDVLEFKRSVPIIKYKDIYPYIQRIANGEDSSLITGHPISEILCSSGTSAGEPKLMPTIYEDLDRRTFFYNLTMPIVSKNGSDTRGYFVWSFMDLYELLIGYDYCFGLYSVNFSDSQCKRSPKLSARWYSSFLEGETTFLGSQGITKLQSNFSSSSLDE